MSRNKEEAAFMEAPCMCDCGAWFDLDKGNPCGSCPTILCEDCITEPHSDCPKCKTSAEE